jgi:hypothetical protein
MFHNPANLLAELGQVCKDPILVKAPVPALDLFAALPPAPSAAKPSTVSTAAPVATAAERVIASELQARGQNSDALSMMVSSMVRMVQVGKQRDSRWKAS